MRRTTVPLITLFLVITILAAPVHPSPQDTLIRQSGEGLQVFGQRIIPPSMRLAHPVVTGNFGPSPRNLVVLFQPEEYREIIGWVLIPEGGSYRKYDLPFGPLPVSTTVKAVFFADVDRDRERELIIICEHISGVGRAPGNMAPFCNTYIFDWTGSGFIEREALAADIDSCRASRVRRLLEKK